MSETQNGKIGPISGGSDLSPGDAFAILGNETRFDILRALWEASAPRGSPTAVPFSELYDRVEYGDTGNFTYHLEKLVDHFVRRTDEGYELTAPGREIVQLMATGSNAERANGTSTAIDVPCPSCDRSLELAYDLPDVWLLCTTCDGCWPDRDGAVYKFTIGTGGISNRTTSTVLDASIANSLSRYEMLANGVCPECNGTAHGSLTLCPDHDAGDGRCDSCGYSFLGTLTYECGSCGASACVPGWAPLLGHPALVSFEYQHGIDRSLDPWEAVSRVHGWHEERCPDAPSKLRILVPHGRDELRATIDETGVVDSVRHSPVPARESKPR